MENVALSLVSHTNVGKTTLARTLLRRDVGTVLDQAHVTEVSEAWPMIETEQARLLLWDTPGFGDSARLLRRLRRQGQPLGWFLHQVWDRVSDRPLWCSQEAVRNIREEADAVLYLVNAAEAPEDAGYVRPELELLAWTDKPVLVLLNQTGTADGARLESVWRDFVEPFAHVHGVISLDAFSRCWVQEGLLLERVEELLPGDTRSTLAGLRSAWNERNLEIFATAVDALTTHLARSAADREVLPSPTPGRSDRKRAMSALANRLEQRSRALMDTLIAAHGLDGESAAEIHERVEDFRVSGSSPVGVKGGALWGSLVSGAAAGVAADVAAGGLTLGGGALLGAVLGALGGAGLARGYELVLARGEPCVRWRADFLDGLFRQALLRYLAVAQFGRGRGAFYDDPAGEGRAAWESVLDGEQRVRSRALAAAWRAASRARPETGGAPDSSLRPVVADVLRAALRARFPEAASLLD